MYALASSSVLRYVVIEELPYLRNGAVLRSVHTLLLLSMATVQVFVSPPAPLLSGTFPKIYPLRHPALESTQHSSSLFWNMESWLVVNGGLSWVFDRQSLVELPDSCVLESCFGQKYVLRRMAMQAC